MISQNQFSMFFVMKNQTNKFYCKDVSGMRVMCVIQLSLTFLLFKSAAAKLQLVEILLTMCVMDRKQYKQHQFNTAIYKHERMSQKGNMQDTTTTKKIILYYFNFYSEIYVYKSEKEIFGLRNRIVIFFFKQKPPPPGYQALALRQK